MDVTEKYGKTNTVANICKAHGVPLEHGFIVADAVIHGRYGIWYGEAVQYFQTVGGMSTDFLDDLVDQGSWMGRQWAQAPK